MPPRKKKAPKKVVKQKQKQRQSVVVNINQQRKTVAREPRSKLNEPPKPVQPSLSISPVFQFPQQYDNTNSIISAIKASQNKQSGIVRDVARVDVAEQVSTPLRERERAIRVARFTPQISGLALEEVSVQLPQEPQPQSIPEATRSFASVEGGGRREPIVSVEGGGRREPERRLVTFNLEEGRFGTTEIPESQTGILQSQKQLPFPVPPPEEFQSALYVPQPVDLKPTRPTEPFEEPSPIREALRSGGAEEPPPPPTPPKKNELKDIIKAHNDTIKNNYISQGRTVTDARKDPNYVYITQKGKTEGSKPVEKSNATLIEELRQKDLLGLIP
jgi:hypothetical protein